MVSNDDDNVDEDDQSKSSSQVKVSMPTPACEEKVSDQRDAVFIPGALVGFCVARLIDFQITMWMGGYRIFVTRTYDRLRRSC
jgi:hypothetical protein